MDKRIALVCRRGHRYWELTLPQLRFAYSCLRELPSCPCGSTLVLEIEYYRELNDFRKGPFGGSTPPLRYLGRDTFWRMVRIENAVDRFGEPVEAYIPQPVTLELYDLRGVILSRDKHRSLPQPSWLTVADLLAS